MENFKRFNQLNRKVLIVCGPTATGKTGLGIHLAKQFNGEIISADSRQVYQGMDIATGKDLPKNAKLKTKNYQVGYYLFEQIPVWMLDVVRPNQEFSVAQYYQLAWKVIKDILGRQKLPIVVGGTGFYIKALIEGIKSLGVSPNWLLRKQLEVKSADSLLAELSRLDSFRAAGMNISDRKNKRRLIRAIEIARWRIGNQLKPPKMYLQKDVLSIGLTAPYKMIYQKINQRINQQVKVGAEKEVKRLIDQGFDWKLSSMSAMGYREWQKYFDGQINREAVIKQWQYDEHAYVRRQMTWFRKALRQSESKWFDVSKKHWQDKVENFVNRWYTQTNAKKN